MKTALDPGRKPASAPRSTAQSQAKHVAYVQMSHEQEMEALRKQAAIINTSPESALAFLKRAGLVTPSGQWRRLIRD
jgi:hypothetical protein